jgi:hypothetical protein
MSQLYMIKYINDFNTSIDDTTFKIDFTKKNYEGKTIFHKMCEYDDHEILAKTINFIDDINININTKDNEGNTLLHKINGSEKMLKLILEKNPDINIQNNDGKTALHILYRQYGYGTQNKNLINLLLKRKPNLNLADNSGFTVLHEAVIGGNICEDDIYELINNGANIKSLTSIYPYKLWYQCCISNKHLYKRIHKKIEKEESTTARKKELDNFIKENEMLKLELEKYKK